MAYQVKTYMNKLIPTIMVDASALEASKEMLSKHRGYLIVLEKGRPNGILTERDLVRKVLAMEKDPRKVTASEVMSAPLITVDPDSSIEDAVGLMAKHGIRRLPVVREGILYGMFSARDLAQHFQEYEDRVTRDIIRGLSFVSLPF